MTRLALSNLQHRRILRFLALMLVWLVAMSSLTTHAAMQANPVDCIAVEQLHEANHSEEHNCGTCTAVIPRMRLALAGPAEQKATSDMAFIPHTPLPPRRPPRT